MTDAIQEVMRAAEELLEALEESSTHLGERIRLVKAVVAAEKEMEGEKPCTPS